MKCSDILKEHTHLTLAVLETEKEIEYKSQIAIQTNTGRHKSVQYIYKSCYLRNRQDCFRRKYIWK